MASSRCTHSCHAPFNTPIWLDTPRAPNWNRVRNCCNFLNMLRIELFMDAIRRNKRCSSPLACHARGRQGCSGEGGGSCNSNTSMRHITSKLNYGHADASTKATNKLSIKAAQKYATSAARGTRGGSCNRQGSKWNRRRFVCATAVKLWQGVAWGWKQYLGRCAPEKQILNLLQFTMSWRKCLL